MIRFNKEIQGTRESDHYATPKKFYKQIDDEFNFDYDPCPLRSEFDGLKTDWVGNIYVNPPYSNIEPFLTKAIDELRKKAKKIVFLIPVRSDTKYWHNIIMRHASEIRFIKGRLNFNESKSPAPFPCVLVVFEKNVPRKLKLQTLTQFQ